MAKRAKGHPIVQQVMERLRKRAGESLALPAPAVDELKLALTGMFGKPELVEAVSGLATLAYFLAEKQKSSQAAAAVMAVAETAVDALKALGSGAAKAGDTLRASAQALKNMAAGAAPGPRPAGPRGAKGVRVRKR